MLSTWLPADPDEVFSFVSDTRNDPEWCPNVTDVRQVSGAGVEVGASFQFHQRVEVTGRQLVSDVHVGIIEVGERRIRWRVEDRFQIRDVVVSVEPDGEGSRVVQTTTAAFKRKPGPARWLYPKLARRTFKDQFGNLVDRYSYRSKRDRL